MKPVLAESKQVFLSQIEKMIRNKEKFILPQLFLDRKYEGEGRERTSLTYCSVKSCSKYRNAVSTTVYLSSARTVAFDTSTAANSMIT